MKNRGNGGNAGAIAFGDGVERFKGSRVQGFNGKTFPLNL
jgi:hypothetical protein